MALVGSEARATKGYLAFMHEFAENWQEPTKKTDEEPRSIDVDRGPSSLEGTRITDSPGADYDRFFKNAKFQNRRKLEREFSERLDAGDTSDEILAFAFFEARQLRNADFGAITTPFDDVDDSPTATVKAERLELVGVADSWAWRKCARTSASSGCSSSGCATLATSRSRSPSWRPARSGERMIFHD
jgi:hypothetical protein